MNPEVFRRPRAEKPVLGVMPRRLWIENRCDDILEYIEELRRGQYKIPPSLVQELADHLRTLDGMK
jgi:hypothetical protein